MAVTSPLFLCVDAGGTKTLSAIADGSGKIVARGYGGAANMAELGVAHAVDQIILSVQNAIAHLQVDHTPIPLQSIDDSWVCTIRFTTIWCGISGCDTHVDVQVMSKVLKSMFRQPIFVCNDALLLSSTLLCRPKTDWAIAVIAGTGSIVYGLTAGPSKSSTIHEHLHVNGDVASSSHAPFAPRPFGKRGGYGHLFGDKGSGYHLGLTAIEVVVEQFDDGEESEGGLANALRQYFGVESSDQIPAAAHEISQYCTDTIVASNERKLRISGLSPLVLGMAEQGDVLAVIALQRATKAIAEDIIAVTRLAKRKGYQGTGGLIIAGGLGCQDLYIRHLTAALHKAGVEFAWTLKVPIVAEEVARTLSQTHVSDDAEDIEA